MPGINRVLTKVVMELDRSITKHGDWSGYEPEDMIEKIGHELMEAEAAAAIGDIEGEHGVYNELSQVAATAIKGMLRLKNERFALCDSTCKYWPAVCMEGKPCMKCSRLPKTDYYAEVTHERYGDFAGNHEGGEVQAD